MKTGLEYHTAESLEAFEIGVLNGRKEALQDAPENRVFINRHFQAVLDRIEAEKQARKNTKK